MTDKLRIDKWLWAARFYKTRSLAVEEIDKGRVRINDLEVKPSREVKVGDTLALRQGTLIRTVVVRGISSQRGPAPVAQQLYEETAESLANKAQAAEQRHLTKGRHSREGGNPVTRLKKVVMPFWIPAFAGMTGKSPSHIFFVIARPQAVAIDDSDPSSRAQRGDPSSIRRSSGLPRFARNDEKKF